MPAGIIAIRAPSGAWSGSSASVASSATPIRTALQMLPSPGDWRSGNHARSTSALTSTVAARTLIPACSPSPSASTVQGELPRSEVTRSASPAPNTASPASSWVRRAGPGTQRERSSCTPEGYAYAPFARSNAEKSYSQPRISLDSREGVRVAEGGSRGRKDAGKASGGQAVKTKRASSPKPSRATSARQTAARAAASSKNGDSNGQVDPRLLEPLLVALIAARDGDFSS